MSVTLASMPGAWRNPVAGRQSSPYGKRKPITLPSGATTAPFHGGQDIAAPTGTPVHAPTDGVVVESGWAGKTKLTDGRSGQYVLLRTHDGWDVYIGHLDTVTARPGARVGRGDVLGTVGQTGNASGPHAHVETRIPGTTRTTDPLPIFAARGVTLGTDNDDEEDPMANLSPDALAGLERFGRHTKSNPANPGGASDFDLDRFKLEKVWEQRGTVAKIAAELATVRGQLAGVLKALETAPGVDVDLTAVREAARAGAAAAIDGIDVTVRGN